MPKVGQKDPHMKSPLPRLILIVIIVAIIIFVIGPRVIDIYNDNLNETNERADNS